MTPEHFEGEISARLTLAGTMLESAVTMARNRDPDSAAYRNLKKIFTAYSESLRDKEKPSEPLLAPGEEAAGFGGIKGL